jgi:hypothetical protein
MLVGNIVYNAPALAGQNGFVRTALGGWELSSILTYASGPSLTIEAGGTGGAPGLPSFSINEPGGVVATIQGTKGGVTGTGYNTAERPNRVGGQSCRSSLGGTSWFNPGAFTLDHYALGSDPTSPRGVCLGPGNAQTDFSIGKNFKITERVTAKFSMDFFNIFNKTQFIATSIPNNLSGSGVVCSAADVTDTANFPWCSGYTPNSLFWKTTDTQWGPFPAGSPQCPGAQPCSLTIPAALSGNFGTQSSTRDPRQIQYNLRIQF